VSSILPTKRLMHQFAFSVENALNTSYRDYLSRFRYYADQQGINIIINYSINI
jgi:iron complex outermembrane receptor protein